MSHANNAAPGSALGTSHHADADPSGSYRTYRKRPAARAHTDGVTSRPLDVLFCCRFSRRKHRQMERMLRRSAEPGHKARLMRIALAIWLAKSSAGSSARAIASAKCSNSSTGVSCAAR